MKLLEEYRGWWISILEREDPDYVPPPTIEESNEEEVRLTPEEEEEYQRWLEEGDR